MTAAPLLLLVSVLLISRNSCVSQQINQKLHRRNALCGVALCDGWPGSHWLTKAKQTKKKAKKKINHRWYSRLLSSTEMIWLAQLNPLQSITTSNRYRYLNRKTGWLIYRFRGSVANPDASGFEEEEQDDEEVAESEAAAAEAAASLSFCFSM